MLINKFKKDEYNIFISLKEINANKENKIYFYILPIEWISFVKEIKYKYNILFYDQYIDDRRIFIQSDNYYDNVNNFNQILFMGQNQTLIISTCLIENYPCLKIVKNNTNKIYIIMYYSLIYECLTYDIVFNECDLFE